MIRIRTTAVGIAATVALVASLGFAAAPAASAAAEPTYPADGAGALPVTPAGLPLLEPAIGMGAALVAGVDTRVPVGAAASAAHSALVRVTLTRAAAATTLDVAGFAALVADAGESATATVLAPVRDGAVVVRSDAAALVRVELVAAFSAAPGAPGAVRALDTPVTRADSAQELATDAAGLPEGATATVGLLGEGGVPTDGVRASFVSAWIDSAAGARLSIDGQDVPVAAGKSMVTTVVTPDATGGFDLTAIDGDLTAVRVAVTGFVDEPVDSPGALQGPGSFITAEPTDSVALVAPADESQPLDLEAPAGSLGTLALLTEADAAALAALEISATTGGRTSGTIVDGTRGAAPQLVWVAAGARALARGADVEANLVPVGHVLGAPVAHEAAPTIEVTSPAPTVDATDTLTFEFEGTLTTPGDVAQRIEVSLDGESYGSAHLTADGGWALEAAVQQAGAHRFDFEIVTRGGSRASATWQGTIALPSADEVIVAADTVVVDAADGISDSEENAIRFTAEPPVAPGDVIVAAATEATPNGFLGRATAIDVIDGEWIVQTEPATLTDVFLQVDVSETLAINDGEWVEATGGEETAELDGQPVAAEPVIASWESVESDGSEFAALPESSLDDSPVTGSGTAGGSIAPMSATIVDPAALAPPTPSGSAKAAVEKSIVETITAEFEYGDEIKIRAEALVKLALKVTIDIEVAWTEGSWLPPKPPLPYANLTKFATVLESTAAAEATVTAEVSKGYSWKASKPFAKEFSPITFSVGPVPVVITSRVDVLLAASVSIDGNAKVTVETKYQRTQEMGFQFAGGKASLVNPGPVTTVQKPTFTEDSGISASFTAEAGPTLSLTAKLWDLAGPRIGVSLKAAMSAEGSATVGQPFLTASAELAIVGTFFVDVLVQVPVIDHTLIDQNLLNTTKKWVIWKGSFDLKNLLSPGPPVPDDDEGETDYGQGETTPATDVLDAIEIVGADATGAYFIEGPPHPSAFGRRTAAVGGFPTEGDDYIAMSTGSLLRLEGDETPYFSEVPSARAGAVYDTTTLRIDLDIPQGVNCLIGFDFRFYSDEYPEYVGSQYNDAFVAEFGKTSWEVQGTDVYAPRNFAFDELGNPITVNAAGAFTINAANAAGTVYDGATSQLRASSPVVSGPTSLYLSIFDQGDGVLDSTVFIDRIEFASVVDPAVDCSAGVEEG